MLTFLSKEKQEKEDSTAQAFDYLNSQRASNDAYEYHSINEHFLLPFFFIHTPLATILSPFIEWRGMSIFFWGGS